MTYQNNPWGDEEADHWTDHVSRQYRQFLQKVANDHGEELSRLGLGVIFHHYAEVVLKKNTSVEHHQDIERVFGFNVGMLPNNPWHDAKRTADSIALPILRSADNYAGAPAKKLAAWIEQQLLQYEQKIEDYLRSRRNDRR